MPFIKVVLLMLSVSSVFTHSVRSDESSTDRPPSASEIQPPSLPEFFSGIYRFLVKNDLFTRGELQIGGRTEEFLTNHAELKGYRLIELMVKVNLTQLCGGGFHNCKGEEIKPYLVHGAILQWVPITIKVVFDPERPGYFDLTTAKISLLNVNLNFLVAGFSADFTGPGLMRQMNSNGLGAFNKAQISEIRLRQVVDLTSNGWVRLIAQGRAELNYLGDEDDQCALYEDKSNPKKITGYTHCYNENFQFGADYDVGLILGRRLLVTAGQGYLSEDVAGMPSSARRLYSVRYKQMKLGYQVLDSLTLEAIGKLETYRNEASLPGSASQDVEAKRVDAVLNWRF